MSANPKPRGGSNSEVTKLKILWRDSMSDAARDYWRSQFISSRTQADLRSELKTKLKIALTRDGQLTDFRAWLARQDELDKEAEAQHQDELHLRQIYGDKLTAEQYRQLALKATYNRGIAKGNYDLVLKTLREDRGLMQAQTDRSKFHRETCELFVKWTADKRASEIANSTASNSEKIERLGQLMFGEDWKS